MKSYIDLSDEKIIELIGNGDLEAQEYLIKKYKNLVKYKTRKYFIVGADRDDLIQEGMIGLFKAITDYNVEKDVLFSSFANLCITRQVITAIKNATRKKHMPLNSYLSLNKQFSEEDSGRTGIEMVSFKNISNPEALFINQEDKEFIEGYINDALSKMEYEVLSLYLLDKNYSEIAKILNIDEKAVDNAIQRLRKKIEKALGKKYSNLSV